MGGEGHETAATVQQALRQADEEEGLGVLGEELGLLAQRLSPAAVVRAGGDEADAEDCLVSGNFVSVVSKTGQRLEDFGFGVGDVEHGHGHGHNATERRIAKLQRRIKINALRRDEIQEIAA